MLSALDETLLHQGPTTFDHALTSDHRFFDRTVIGAYSPDGSIALLIGLAVYKNMNVMEGFVLLQHGGREQINLRFSRSLRPDLQVDRIGPLSVSVRVPFRHLNLSLPASANERMAFDIDWQSDRAPHEERHQFGRLDGRAVRDHCRFDQVARCTGSITLDGQTFDVRDWFGWRDHSWGVRPGVGGFEPFTGGHDRDPDAGFMLIWLLWSCRNGHGALQIQEDGSGRRLFLDGRLHIDGQEDVAIVDATHDIHFLPGKRVADSASFVVKTEAGTEHRIETTAIGRPWALRGGGYDRGFLDGKALGVWRAPMLREADVYDVTDPEDIRMEDGTIVRPAHREQPVSVTVDGDPGFGHFPLILAGPNRTYGLAAPRR